MSRYLLRGCSPTPLISYLKSIAVLRLVASQWDPQAKARWNSDVFELDSAFPLEQLVRFFLDEYRPTPIVAPWNGGSGFYEGDKIDGREAIRKTTSARFANYREIIESILAWPELPSTGLSLGKMIADIERIAAKKRGKAKEDLLTPVQGIRLAIVAGRGLLKEDLLLFDPDQLEKQVARPESSSKLEEDRVRAIKEVLKHARKLRTIVKKLGRAAGKEEIVRACRNRLSDLAVEWIDAAVSLSADDKLAYPPILGTAGSEGRFDYTNSFMRHVADMIVSPANPAAAEELLKNALYGDPCGHLTVASVGQYEPGRAGGFNQGPGIETKHVPTNPWNFILAMEGAIAWASGVARRQGARGGRFLCSPFTVGATAVGYSSSASGDELGPRTSEIWAPLWNRFVGYPELRAFLSEGRAEVGRKPATQGIEFAAAAASLGVDRGVNEFVRYSLLQRRGESYVALPAARFPVHVRRESDLLRELDPILHRIDRFERSFKAEGLDPPDTFSRARRSIDTAIYDVLLHGGPNRVKQLIAAIGRIEQFFSRRGSTKKPKLSSPLAGLHVHWVLAADDASIEVRLAAALASIGPTDKVGPIRANIVPINPQKPWSWSVGKDQFAWNGNSLAARLAAVLSRRMMDADRLLCRTNPVRGSLGLHVEDIAALIERQLDERLLEDLFFGFTWVRWEDWEAERETLAALRNRWSQPVAPCTVPRSWSLLKLLFLPDKLRVDHGKEVNLRSEPAIIPLLLAGRVNDACRIARRRLFASGLTPLHVEFQDADDGTRLAAALLVPLRSAGPLAKRVLNADLTRI